MYPGNQPNVAQIIPPDTRTGQLALNGDLHVIDKVLLPNPRAFCRAGDFEFYMGSAFSSVISSQQDQSGQVINSIVPRAFAYDFCDKLPCTYEIPGLYGRAGGKPMPTAPPEAAEGRWMLGLYGRAGGQPMPTAPPEAAEGR